MTHLFGYLNFTIIEKPLVQMLLYELFRVTAGGSILCLTFTSSTSASSTISGYGTNGDSRMDMELADAERMTDLANI